jgi:hypothetical protein
MAWDKRGGVELSFAILAVRLTIEISSLCLIHYPKGRWSP